ncbi:TPA: primase C-terminal domain-containing protein [Enterococcus faecium]
MAYNLDVVYSTILQNGIRKFKYKNSRLKPVSYIDQSGKGAIFAYRSKEHMADGMGVVITSEEAVSANKNQFSHWTPNVYRYGKYSDQYRLFPTGHGEDNLRQINTFYIDVDTLDPNFKYGELILDSFEMGFMPTMVLKSPRGYQFFYVLEKPAYVNKNTDFKVIDCAKRISKNLRDFFSKKGYPVDLNANHFGITRIPADDSILYFEADQRYSFKEWIDWSINYEFENMPKKNNVYQLKSKREFRQVDDPWFRMLLFSEKIRGQKGVMGRNNVIFTLSLAYYSSGYEIDECELTMLEFNDRLQSPLRNRELTKIIKSAYSGKYQAADRKKIIILCQEWVDVSLGEDQLFAKRPGLYKFKKDRSVRKYSHLHEWAGDLLAYLDEHSYTHKPYIITTKKDIRESLKIPERSLDKVLKHLKKENKIYFRVRSGRNGGITLASVKALMSTIIRVKKEVQEAYFIAISEAFGLKHTEVYSTFEKLLNPKNPAVQTELFELDTG